MKHERIVAEPDVAPATFIRSVGICVLIGVAFWTAVFLLIF